MLRTMRRATFLTRCQNNKRSSLPLLATGSCSPRSVVISKWNQISPQNEVACTCVENWVRVRFVCCELPRECRTRCCSRCCGSPPQSSGSRRRKDVFYDYSLMQLMWDVVTMLKLRSLTPLRHPSPTRDSYTISLNLQQISRSDG